MNLLSLYHRLPYWAKVLTASLRGLRLRRDRYGGLSETDLQMYREQEYWDRQQWDAWRTEKLPEVLENAARNVPYYRDYWQRRRRSGDDAGWRDLKNWPVLSKDEVRRRPEAFISDAWSGKKLIREQTSGTTGTPLSVSVNREALRKWYALHEVRTKNWYGVSFRDRWAMLGGQLVAPYDRDRPPYWVYNAALRQLYLSTHHLSPENLPAYAGALKSFRPMYLVVYPSSGSVLAEYLLKQAIAIDSVKVVFSNAEILLERQRQSMSRAFNAPVVNTYGMGEQVVAASECAHGTMHLWPEVQVLEVFEDSADQPVRAGSEVGRLITTGLLNPVMPLIRYEVGDRGAVDEGSALCSCGRRLPKITALEGRMVDNLRTPDGRKIFWINPVFYGMPVVEAQVIQHKDYSLLVNIVPDSDFGIEEEQEIRKRLAQRTGQTEIQIMLQKEIPRDPNGKFRSVISFAGSGPENRP